jgi:hypothetical protein
MHVVVVEESSAARATSVVSKPLDRQAIGKPTGFDDRHHLRLSALDAGQRLRDRCFSWKK